MSSTTKKNCLNGYSGSNSWDIGSMYVRTTIEPLAPEGGSMLIPEPDMKERLLRGESELKGKHSYYFTRFCDDTIFCDICGQTKLKINVFKNNNEVGNDRNYLACVRCKRP